MNIGRAVIYHFGVVIGICAMLPVSLAAQRTGTGRSVNGERGRVEAQPSEPPIQTIQNRELGDTVALLPWSYKNGKDPAVQSAREVCNQLLLETGFNVFLTKIPSGAIPPAMPGSSASQKPESPFTHLLDQGRALLGQETSNRSDAPYVLPTLDQMTAIGAKVGARYILAGRAQWSHRNVWVGIANRVKAICTVDIRILDMSTGKLVLEAKNVAGDSTENKSPFNTITSVISLNPLPLVIPGSVTPQQQRAVTVAIARAMEPWIKTERIKAALTQADESGEAAAGGPTPKFSTLVSRLNDLQANMQVTVHDPKQVQALDSDLAKVAALREVTLEYKEPNRLRLSAVSPQDGQMALIVNEAQRIFTEPYHKIVHKQDVSTAPDRRLSVLNFCGLLTPGLFDTLRARYVRQEKVNGANTVVYDLSYWGIDTGPYQRAWIDPGTHVILKRAVYDRAGKLRMIGLYEQPKQIAPHIWIPTRGEMRNADQKVFASFTLSAARVDQGISDDRFTIATDQKTAAK
jgi:outer membrane lipoprotein-sorting protein